MASKASRVVESAYLAYRTALGSILAMQTQQDLIPEVWLCEGEAAQGCHPLRWPHCPPAGSPEERGLVQWKAGAHANSETSASLKSYDFPFGMAMVKRSAFLRYIPICPVFRGFANKSENQTPVPEDTPNNTETASVCTKVWN